MPLWLGINIFLPSALYESPWICINSICEPPPAAPWGAAGWLSAIAGNAPTDMSTAAIPEITLFETIMVVPLVETIGIKRATRRNGLLREHARLCFLADQKLAKTFGADEEFR